MKNLTLIFDHCRFRYLPCFFIRNVSFYICKKMEKEQKQSHMLDISGNEQPETSALDGTSDFSPLDHIKNIDNKTGNRSTRCCR